LLLFLLIVIVSVFDKRCRFDGAKVVCIFQVAIKRCLISCSVVATGARIHDKTDERLQNMSQKHWENHQNKKNYWQRIDLCQ